MSNEAYSNDIGQYGDYIYTGIRQPLSAKLANIRIRSGLEKNIDYNGKTVLDIGSGDGNFTYEFIERGAAFVLGIDPVNDAVISASKNYAHIENIRFECHDICTMPVPSKKFDIAMLRGVLHHIPDMAEGVRAACSMAKEVVLVDPNGYNPILKIIEKTSSYHIDHKERSYYPHIIKKEFCKNGGIVLHEEYVNLVPFFCPDWLARILFAIAPIAEAIPVVRHISCGQYILHVRI